MSYNKLVESRKNFLEQLYNLCKYQLTESLEGEERIRTISIDASWGMGKTFFAKAFSEFVSKKNKENSLDIKIMEFNAWSTDYFNEPMKSLIGELSAHELIGLDSEIKAKKLFINTGKKALKVIGKIVQNKVGISDECIETVKDIITDTNKSELEDYKEYKKIVEDFKSCYDADKKMKIIVIDELDRCRPNYAIELLETIKHIFDIKNIVFVFMVNKDQLMNIVSTMYVGNDGSEEYFEKFFDIQFKMPEVDYEEYMESEYSNYLDTNIYKVDINNRSKEIIKFSEFLFLEMFKNNEEIFSKVRTSIRTMKNAFRKYKILLESLEEKERDSYPLILSLCIYVLIKELNWKSETTSKKDVLMEEIILNTFFRKKLPNETGIRGIPNYEYKYIGLNREIYKYLFLNLKYGVGDEKKLEHGEIEMHYSVFQTIKRENRDIKWNIGGRDIVFSVWCDYGIANEYYSQYPILLLPLEESFIKKCVDGKENVIRKWCSKKYEFIRNM